MRIIVIGATGTIGTAVADELERRHEVVRVSRRGSTGRSAGGSAEDSVQADLRDTASIDALLDRAGRSGGVDAVVCCAASGALTPLDDPSDAAFWIGLDGKLVGQVNLVRHALGRLRDGGSVTLTSGRFAEPVPGSSMGHLVNAGLEAFVRAAAVELPRGLRLNAVSPGWVRETLVSLGMDPADGVPAAEVARVYAQAVEGSFTGRTLAVRAVTRGESPAS
ncbi:short chain dehydrogenase [Nonomuraea sp. 3-1Str]|uniref:short chain dehydrogenase n=1 Tax=Nonomuraea sp. 3-1Str TaxID=2929801 RepID=UPI002863E80F|nr:short chain dehydrogenase [Nonomuraea sp. 3-1Str]MDR8409399.1 short chain dehydrogenase [Nonomuraea sp. 3-1Str]